MADVLKLAFPMVLSTLSWTVMQFLDRMFLYWHLPEEMAAAMPAGMVSFSVLCFPLGLVSYVSTFVAQYIGAQQPDRIGRIVWQAVWLGLFCTPLFLLLSPLSSDLFAWARHGEVIARMESDYFRVLLWGAGAAVLESALSGFYTGRGAVRVVLAVSLVGAVANSVLDVLWIFGYLGFPEAGIVGAAWATVVATWLKVIVYVFVIRMRSIPIYEFRQGCVWDSALILRLIRFGGPNGLQMLVEVASFTVFLLLLGRLGPLELTATSLAFNVNSIAFVPMIGLGISVMTIVGQQVGRRRPDLAAKATWNALALALSYSTVMAVSYVAVPDLFLMGFQSETNTVVGVRDGGVRDLTVVLLRFVAAYCLLDAMNLVFCSAVKGAGDTLFVLVVSIAMSAAAAGGGWYGLEYLGWGLMGFWTMVTVWISSLGLVYMARFCWGPWRSMRVIEDRGP
ncbi:MAG: MATE family efflux transporter [Planctomycetota bacterium]|nr:MATE family efflux transporter [Planctomycetota bacterium]